MKIDIVATSNTEHIAKILSKNSDFHIHYLGKNKDGQRYFPDGELYMRLDKSSGQRTVVLHSGAPKPNDGLVELEFVLELLKERKAPQLELFIAYFPYCKQDLAFEDGEINASEVLIKKWLNVYGVKKIYVIDAHFKGRDWADKYPLEHVSGVDVVKNVALAQYPEIFFITPDTGSARRNSLPGFKKERNNSYDVKISCDKELEVAIKGKIIGVIDDMIETGGTMAEVFKKCQELGTEKTIAAVTHGVLQSGVDRIKNTYDQLFLSNTINCNGANVDISNLIIRTLK